LNVRLLDLDDLASGNEIKESTCGRRLDIQLRQIRSVPRRFVSEARYSDLCVPNTKVKWLPGKENSGERIPVAVARGLSGWGSWNGHNSLTEGRQIRFVCRCAVELPEHVGARQIRCLGDPDCISRDLLLRLSSAYGWIPASSFSDG
jgi:hypothetical protein